MPSSTPRPPNRYRVIATHRDGRVEDLGIHPALTGRRAKHRAVADHAERLGWRRLKAASQKTGLRYDARGWTFKTAVERSADVTITVTHDNGGCPTCGHERTVVTVTDDGGEYDTDDVIDDDEDDLAEGTIEDAIDARRETYRELGKFTTVRHVTRPPNGVSP